MEGLLSDADLTTYRKIKSQQQQCENETYQLQC